MSWFKTLQTRQLKRAHADYIEQLLKSPDFTLERAGWMYHANIGNWIDPALGRTVLEVGCGPGRYAAMMQTLGLDVVGVDPFSFDEWDLIASHGTAKFMSGVFAENLPFPDASFDHVTCIGTLLYVKDPVASLQEMLRVLKPGGRLLVRTVNRTNRFTRRTGAKLDPSSNHLFTRDELRRLVEQNGFVVDRSGGFGFLPPYSPSFWWYLSSVWLTDSALETWGEMGDPEAAHHCLVWAHKPLA